MAHNEDKTCLSEEKLTTLIREIIKEEFEKQQKNLINLISGNFEITTKEIKSIKSEMNYLKKSIEFTKNVLEIFREKLDTEDKIIIERAHRAKKTKKQQKRLIKDNHLSSAEF